MKSNYKTLGNYIKPVIGRNGDLSELPLMGLSIQKKFIPSIANTIGTDMSTYRIIEKNQFAYGPVTSRNGDKITIALFTHYEKALISQAYIPFEIKDINELDPEYLMMWFCRPEFDRYARFKSHGSAREIFDWEEMCNVTIPIPSISKQHEIVKEYNIIQNRINLNQRLIQKLEETAQTIYKQWFIEFEYPNENGKHYKSRGGEMKYNEELEREIPKNWENLSLSKYIKIYSGYAFESKDWTNHGHPVIKIGSIKNNTVSEQDLEYISESTQFNKKNYFVKKGDIVIAMTGFTMGKIGLIPDLQPIFYVNQRVGFFKLGASKYLQSGFLFCTLLTDYVQNEIWSIGGDSRQFNVSNDDIEAIKILIPNSKLVIEEFNALVKGLFDRIIQIQSTNKALFKVRELLHSKLATI